MMRARLAAVLQSALAAVGGRDVPFEDASVPTEPVPSSRCSESPNPPAPTPFPAGAVRGTRGGARVRRRAGAAVTMAFVALAGVACTPPVSGPVQGGAVPMPSAEPSKPTPPSGTTPTPPKTSPPPTKDDAPGVIDVVRATPDIRDGNSSILVSCRDIRFDVTLKASQGRARWLSFIHISERARHRRADVPHLGRASPGQHPASARRRARTVLGRVGIGTGQDLPRPRHLRAAADGPQDVLGGRRRRTRLQDHTPSHLPLTPQRHPGKRQSENGVWLVHCRNLAGACLKAALNRSSPGVASGF